MLANGSGKKAVLLMTLSDKLYTLLILDTLPLFFPILQTKEVWIDNAEDNNPDNNDVIIAITFIQMV